MRFKIDWASLILAYSLFLEHGSAAKTLISHPDNTASYAGYVFLCFTLYLRAVSQYTSRGGGGGGVYLEGRFSGGFYALQVWGLGAHIWRSLYMEGLIFGILRYDSKKIDTV